MNHSNIGRHGTTKAVAFTGTAGSVTSFGGGVWKVRVVVTSAAFVKVGPNAVATSNDMYMPADRPEYFTCSPGDAVSAIQVSAGGNLYATEID